MAVANRSSGFDDMYVPKTAIKAKSTDELSNLIFKATGDTNETINGAI